MNHCTVHLRKAVRYEDQQRMKRIPQEATDDRTNASELAGMKIRGQAAKQG